MLTRLPDNEAVLDAPWVPRGNAPPFEESRLFRHSDGTAREFGFTSSALLDVSEPEAESTDGEYVPGSSPAAGGIEDPGSEDDESEQGGVADEDVSMSS